MSAYSQILIQLVFAVKGRQSLIRPEWEDILFRYITGIVQGQGQKLLAINGMPDHIHILIGIKPSCCLADLVREIKKASSAFIKEEELSRFPFYWQEGYGAFSYSKSQLDTVVKYILNQKEHHRKRSFREEYISFLEEFGIDYDSRYLFDWLEEK
jgi:REP element-mobilizing transposase RayT